MYFLYKSNVVQVERHFIKGNEEIVRLCSLSKELYNRCNFLMRQAWFNYERLPNINVLVQETKDLDCFRNLHNTKTAKQTIMKCLTDWSNFRKALIAWKKDKSKFLKMPKPPYYKKKLAQVIFYNETIKKGKKITNTLTPTNNLFSIKSDKNYRQVVITPKAFGFIIDVSYDVEVEKPKKSKENNFCCIDLGVNNLCAITSDKHSPILINGRIVKSFNQIYNKNKSQNQNDKVSRKRYFRMENYFHHVSNFIIENCIANNITTIIIGKNDGWKQNIKKRMRSASRQNFQSIPFNNLIQKIQYKAEIAGIKVIFTEEAYTSKASFLDRDELPQYDKDVPSPDFSGVRMKRGLYRSKDGVLLNADCNGSGNIGRKVFPNEMNNSRWDRSVAATPIVVNPLKLSSHTVGKQNGQGDGLKLKLENLVGTSVC